jgi:1,4-alpha-glucan branching enzyme
VQFVENQDTVYADRPPADWKPRVAALADPADHRSWYARSRSRVATGIVFTAPGIPMLFMGEEILEDKDWSDNPGPDSSKLIWWDGLTHDPSMSDFLQFCRSLVGVRKNQPSLSGPNVRVFHNYGNRVLGFHRWLEGSGNDVIVIANLNEFNLYNYALGLPWPGAWREAFNSDYFDHFPNPNVTGNGGSIAATGGARDGFGYSTSLVLPANGLLVLVPG